MRLWNKFLVLRRDNTVPDWPYLVIGGRDPAGPAALRAYAAKARELGMDEERCTDIEGLADDFDAYRAEHGEGDPDAPPHREDDPSVVSRFKRGHRTTPHLEREERASRHLVHPQTGRRYG